MRTGLPARPTWPRYAIAGEILAVSIPLEEAAPLKTSDPATITLKLGCPIDAAPRFGPGKRCRYSARAWEMRTDDSMWLRAPQDGRTTVGTLDERALSPAEWSEAVRGWLGNALLASRDGDRFVTMHAAAVALTASDDGILLAGDSYDRKSSIAAALHR